MKNEQPDQHELQAALARIRVLEARVAELSAVLGLSRTAQQEWLRSQIDAPEVTELQALRSGRRVKLTVEVLLEVYRVHKEQGVAPFRIAKTLRVDHKAISNFLSGDYGTKAAAEAYRILGITPKWPKRG